MTVSVGCSPGLWQQLTGHNVTFYAAVEALEPYRDQVLAVLPQLEAAAAGCGAKAVIAELAPLVSLYGVPDKSEGEWKAFWGFYTAALADVPLAALKAAVQDYVKDGKSEFFPKPGPLLALADGRAAPLRMAYSRAKRLCRSCHRLEDNLADAIAFAEDSDERFIRLRQKVVWP
jgi:hypothetical protein